MIKVCGSIKTTDFSYPTNLKYLYTVGLLKPHTLANSQIFRVPAIKAGHENVNL